MKELEFLGDSLDQIRSFPSDAKQDIGYQLDRVQNGNQPDDWKPMSSIGVGVQEIRVKDSAGIYRVIYLAKLKDVVYVLHAFKKKTQKTSSRDLKLASKRLRSIEVKK
jgi:phage-related protein